MFKFLKSSIYSRLVIFISLILLFFNISYGVNINIVGNIEEYSNNYFENVSVLVGCNENLTFFLPSNSYKIYFNGIKTHNLSYILENCSENYNFRYYLDNLDYLGDNLFRVERIFKDNYDNINYSYSIKAPIEFVLDRNKSNVGIIKEEILGNYKLFKFKKAKTYVLYFKRNDRDKFSIYYLFQELKEPIILLLVFFSIFFGFMFSYLIFKRKVKRILELNVPSYVLSEEEKKVLEVIKKDEGINQKQIGKNLNYSKAKVSAIIKDLEEKDLIYRERFGRSFKVYLKKKIV